MALLHKCSFSAQSCKSQDIKKALTLIGVFAVGLDKLAVLFPVARPNLGRKDKNMTTKREMKSYKVFKYVFLFDKWKVQIKKKYKIMSSK